MAKLTSNTAKKPSKNDIISGFNSTRNNDLVAKRYAGQAAKEYAAQQQRLQQQEMARQAASYTHQAQQSQAAKNALTNDLMGQRYQGQAENDFNNALANLGNTPSPRPTGSQNPSTGGGSSGGSSGGGGGGTTPQDPLAAIAALTGTIDPSLKALVPTTGELEVMYNRLKGDIETNKANLDKEYQSSIDSIKSNFGKSNDFIQNAFSGDASTLAKAAGNLGVQGWDSGPTVQASTALLNDLVGTNSANQATDLSWFDKMRTLDTGQLNTTLNLNAAAKQNAVEAANQTMLQLQEMANQEAQALALQELVGSGGGSGGGGGRGGRGRGRYGGSSGKGSLQDFYETLKEAASEQSDQKNVGVAELINSIEDPVYRETARNFLLNNGNDVTKALNDIYEQIGNVNTANYKNPLIEAQRKLLGGSGLGKFLGMPSTIKTGSGPGTDVNFLSDLYNSLMQYDSTFGTETSRSVDRSSTQSNKNYGQPSLMQQWGGSSPNTSKGSSGFLGSVGKNKPKPKTTPPKKKPSTSAKSKIKGFF